MERDEQLNEGAGFGENHDQWEEAEAIIGEAEETEAESESQGEYMAADDPERSARGLVRFCMGAFNWLLQLKDPRVQWDDKTIKKGEDAIAPALVKHGIGSSGVGKYGEEVNAVGFVAILGWNTRQAIRGLRELDEQAAKQKQQQEGGNGGQEPERFPA